MAWRPQASQASLVTQKILLARSHLLFLARLQLLLFLRLLTHLLIHQLQIFVLAARLNLVLVLRLSLVLDLKLNFILPPKLILILVLVLRLILIPLHLLDHLLRPAARLLNPPHQLDLAQLVVQDLAAQASNHLHPHLVLVAVDPCLQTSSSPQSHHHLVVDQGQCPRTS